MTAPGIPMQDSNNPAHSFSGHVDRVARGFTLIELLVVIAINPDAKDGTL